MIRRSVIPLLAYALLSCCEAKPLKIPGTTCGYDRTRLLALDQTHFDQELSGGWRTLAAKPGCQLAAADLLRDYRQAHKFADGILYWHEGQLRAFAGQPEQAIALMERSRKPANADRAGWNPYVDATIAFLRKDRSALDDARQHLAGVKPPLDDDGSPVKDGFIEAKMANGQTMKIRWPPNLDAVDGLVKCFNKPYEIAYGMECRVTSK